MHPGVAYETSTDRIERKILLKAPLARVWRALSDAKEFGDWFGVDFKGKTFVAGNPVEDRSLSGYEHIVMEVIVERVVPERLLSWRWHPAASTRPSTIRRSRRRWSSSNSRRRRRHLAQRRRVRFRQNSTRRRAAAFRMNTSGWDGQMKILKSMSLRRKAAPANKSLQKCARYSRFGRRDALAADRALCVGGAMSITQLTSGTDITRQAITKHLDVLAAAGLVRDVKLDANDCGSSSRAIG